MRFPFTFKSVIGAIALLAAPVTASATPLLHEGALFNAAGGGVGFSFLHTSTDGMGHGSTRGGNILDGGGNHIVGDVAYTWNLSGASLGAGTTITFDQGETIIYRTDTFEVALWTSSSVLTVGAANAGHGSVEGVAVTHDISGEINFEIRQISGANSGAVLADTFEFFTTENMGPVNGIGSAGGSPESFNTYLWGDTGAFNGSCSSDCSEILLAFYAAEGLGIDIAFSGAAVPEPGAVALLGIAFLGFGVVRRRRRR